MVVPAMGFVSDIISGPRAQADLRLQADGLLDGAIAGLGFIVWGHHMFMSGMNPAVGMVFMTATIMIALPSAIKVFNWLGTLWGSRIRLTTPMLFAMASCRCSSSAASPGSGWPRRRSTSTSTTPTSSWRTSTTWCSPAPCSRSSPAIYHWFPKMFGRMMNETLGKIHFFGTFIFTNGVFYMMHQLGIAGLMRRTADPYAYETYAHLQPLNEFISTARSPARVADLLRRELLRLAWAGASASGGTPGKRLHARVGRALASRATATSTFSSRCPRPLRVRARPGRRHRLPAADDPSAIPSTPVEQPVHA